MTIARILVVEDEPDGQALFALWLKNLNYEVEVARDAEQAVVALDGNESGFDLVLIDLHLPGADGWELRRRLAQDPKTAKMPTIATTAYHTNVLPKTCLEAGFDGYVPKPIERTVLMRQLGSALKRSWG